MSENKLSKYVISKKKAQIKKIVSGILDGFEMKKYKFYPRKKLIKVTLHNIDYLDLNLQSSKKEIKEGLRYWFGRSQHLIGHASPDTWMSGNIMIIEEGEIDDNDYELGISLKSFKIKSKSKTKSKSKSKTRPSPSTSATQYNIGTKKRGNNGKMWKVIKTKTGVKRWSRV